MRVKEEPHGLLLSVSFALELIAAVRIHRQLGIRDGQPSLEEQLTWIVLLGLALLPVIGALRRGYRGHALCAFVLALLPVSFIAVFLYGSVRLWIHP